MDEENKSYDDDSIYEEDFEDNFEIGIPIDEALNSPSTSESAESAPDDQEDQDDQNEDSPDNLMSTKTDEETAVEPETEEPQGESFFKETGEQQEAQSPVGKFVENDIPDEIQIPAPSALDEINEQLKDLSRTFESKLKYDAHKNKIIDDLHQSLQEYREGLVKKYLHRIVTDIIKIVDDMRKFSAHYKNQSGSEKQSDDTTEKLYKYIENIASDLEDLFAWEGVTPFTCDGDVFDPSRQRILKKIETDDPEKDKTVAERLRPGYEWDGKIIRPEMVSAYVYPAEATAEDNND